MNQNISGFLNRRACPNCQGVKSATTYFSAERSVLRCQECDFVYLPFAAEPAYFVDGDGAWENAQVANIERRLETAPLRMRLSLSTRFRTKFLKKTPVAYLNRHFSEMNACQIKVLDIGCGSGGYLQSLDERYVPFGIELSNELWQSANISFQARGGFAVHGATVDVISEFDAGSLDAVVMRSYLEHEAEPKRVLISCRELIKADGVIVLKVPNFASINRGVMGESWCGFRFPDHVNYFTPKSLTRMAAAAGFRTVQRFADKLPTSDNMWAVLIPE